MVADFDPGRLLQQLVARGVDFVVIGGVAAVIHGSARNTEDLDVCFATDEVNLEALGQTLVGFKARLRGVDEDVPFVPDAATLRRVDVLTLTTELGDLDVLARPDGAPSYEALRRNAERHQLDGFAVLVASIPDLLAMKRAAGRAKDLADIEELEAIVRLRARV
jgi:predicted nucleotidyltransferase